MGGYYDVVDETSEDVADVVHSVSSCSEPVIEKRSVVQLVMWCVLSSVETDHVYQLMVVWALHVGA